VPKDLGLLFQASGFCASPKGARPNSTDVVPRPDSAVSAGEQSRIERSEDGSTKSEAISAQMIGRLRVASDAPDVVTVLARMQILRHGDIQPQLSAENDSVGFRPYVHQTFRDRLRA
jgi:hypothetical protein